MKLKSESEVAQSCPTLSDLMDCSLTGSSIHEIFQARVLEWGAIAFSEIYRSHGEIQYLYHSHSVTTIKCVFDSFLNFCFQRTIIQYSDFPKNNKVQIFFNAVYHSPRHHNIVMYLHHYFSRGRFQYLNHSHSPPIWKREKVMQKEKLFAQIFIYDTVQELINQIN